MYGIYAIWYYSYIIKRGLLAFKIECTYKAIKQKLEISEIKLKDTPTNK